MELQAVVHHQQPMQFLYEIPDFARNLNIKQLIIKFLT